MWVLRFVLDLPPADQPALASAETEPPPADLLAFDTDAVFAQWSERLSMAPQLRARPWGSAFAHDPWPSPYPADSHPAVQKELRDRFNAQAAGIPTSLTWQSIASGSYVRLEAHDAALVLQITVDPHETQPIEGSQQPAELPVDLAALLQPLPLLQEADLVQAIAPLLRPETDASPPSLLLARRALQQLGALWADDLRLLDVLRLCADHPQATVRSSVIAVASQAGYRLFLYERAAIETDPLLLRVLGTVTSWPAPEGLEGAGS